MNPFEPTADARNFAAIIWSQYQAYIDVGFTQPEAMSLIRTQLRQPPKCNCDNES